VATHAVSRRRPRDLRAFVRLWIDLVSQHRLPVYGAAIAFQTFVAAIAVVLLGLGVLGAIGRGDVWARRIAPQIHKRVLPDVYAGINQTVQHIFAHDSTWLILFASALALWKTSTAVRMCMRALTHIYETEDDRPAWLRLAISVGIAAAMVVALIGAVLLVVVARGPSGGLVVPFDIARWIGAVVLVGIAFGLLIRFAPAERRAKKWATTGAALVVGGWIVQSLLFEVYVTSIASFRTAAGTLLAFLVVTTFFSVAAMVLLVGIELDELLRQNA